MKKILGIALLLLLMLFPNVFAEELPTISVGSFDASIGEEITVPVTLENNQDFACIGVKISYDVNSLKYVSAKLKGFENAQMKEVTNNNDTIVLYALVYEGDQMLHDNGVIAEIKFQVKENAVDSGLKIVSFDFGDKDLNRFETKKNDGEVKILERQSSSSTKDLSKLVESDKKVKWKSSDEKVAIVSEDGKVTFKEDGNVVISATDEDGNVLFEKKYKIGDNKKKNREKKKIPIVGIGISVTIVTLIASVMIILYRKRKVKI